MTNKTFFTSDLHMYHKKIKDFCPKTRLGIIPETQVEVMIKSWNTQVAPLDTVWVLGDVSFEHGSYEKTIKALRRMNGIKRLIVGNHDYSNTLAIYRREKVFNTIDTYFELKKVLDETVVLCHYPIYEWNRCHHGAYHLYGHVHGRKMKALEPYRAMDVGLDAVLNYGKPTYHLWTAEEIQKQLKDKAFKKHH